ncbi:Glycosyltransferase involved in cell wall bisynthesis [Butyrivibrio proteoclasticus]|uniref:Glycosyltransferase involved in cell wall bisynthesis n=1 Tax=Butyrivibrio proteoclasticus TaxID=43305 RepID=A0A1I5PR06_9FIRM|nr:glycosyltransferase family 4 protein [Butyrivibrio proteoclasticus]SFP36444.1 Glycosyltransferase involved in cell wall bisynthesis [Butyrivibrio proteoclasticus]
MNKSFTNRILGIDVAVTNLEDTIELIAHQIDEPGKDREKSQRYIKLVSVEDLLAAQTDKAKRKELDNAEMLIPVSEPIAWIQRLRGFKTVEAIREKKLKEQLAIALGDRADECKLSIVSPCKSTSASTITFLLKSIPDAFKWQRKRLGDKKNLLIYAHYYYPDVASTGQILTELAEGLNDTFHTTVICTVPSYTGKIDKEYKKHKYYYENINGVDVLRIRVPEFRKNFSPSRIINIISYFISAIFATARVGHQDYVYTISQPPVLGGLLGVFGKLIKRAKFIYNIQDFNPEQVMAVSFTGNKFVLGTMMWLDKLSCRFSDKVIVVGRDMVETLKKRFPENMPDYVHINNWINEKEIVPLEDVNEKVTAFKEKYGIKGKFVIMYSGNIGLYYDLLEIEKIIKEFDAPEFSDVIFAFVGQGTVLEEMKAYQEKEKLKNIVFIPYQNKEDLVYSLNAGDVHFVVNAKGIKGVSVPSKLYGVMAAGKPVLGILEEGSEARLIVEEAQCGVVADPGDYDAIRKVIRYFIDNRGSKNGFAVNATDFSEDSLHNMGMRGRRFLDEHLTRDVSIKKYADEILKIR